MATSKPSSTVKFLVGVDPGLHHTGIASAHFDGEVFTDLRVQALSKPSTKDVVQAIPYSENERIAVVECASVWSGGMGGKRVRGAMANRAFAAELCGRLAALDWSVVKAEPVLLKGTVPKAIIHRRVLDRMPAFEIEGSKSGYGDALDATWNLWKLAQWVKEGRLSDVSDG